MEEQNGLQLSERYYREIALPYLQSHAPELLPCLAAGLVGEGSDCFGYDDLQSRDHDWGPALCLWGTQADALPKMQNLLRELPDTFLGYPVRKEDARTGAFTVEGFYRRLIGRPDAPTKPEEWLAIPESALAAAVNGTVFWDGPGAFSAVRRNLEAYYPEPVRIRLLAQHAALAAQTGQYNYLRCTGREDLPAAATIVGRFLESSAAMVFLLNRKYRPFYKWTFRAMKDLPILGADTYSCMEQLSMAQPGSAVFRIIEQISSALITELKAQNLTSSNSDFLMDHCGELLTRITDPELRAKPVSLVLY